MGVAAYNRGSAVIRRQIAEDYEKRPFPHLNELVNTLNELEAVKDNCRHRIKEMQDQLAERDAEIQSLTAELEAIKAQRESDKKFKHALACRVEQFQRNWRRASELLRLLPPDKVQELRDLRDMHKPPEQH